jgi:hypothetical protein
VEVQKNIVLNNKPLFVNLSAKGNPDWNATTNSMDLATRMHTKPASQNGRATTVKRELTLDVEKIKIVWQLNCNVAEEISLDVWLEMLAAMTTTNAPLILVTQLKDASTPQLTATITMHAPLNIAILFLDVSTRKRAVMMEFCAPEIAATHPLENVFTNLIPLFAGLVLEDLAKLILTVMHGLNPRISHPNANKHTVMQKLEAACPRRKDTVQKNAEQVACQSMHVIMLTVFWTKIPMIMNVSIRQNLVMTTNLAPLIPAITPLDVFTL